MYDDLIKKLEADEQFGTATTYKNALSSFKAYIKKDNLNIEDINVEFLKRYEKWMEQPKTYITKTGKLIGRDGNSRTSIGIYVRTLRRMFNIAIKEGIVSEGAYPFGRDKYIIPSGRKAKRSLKLNEVAKLYNYEPKGLYGSHYLFAKDMWVFSYLANGINMKDLAFLKYRSMSSETIVFFREKTKNTNKDNEIQIKVDLNDKLREIIKRWGNKNTHPENYIFPIVTHSMSSKEKHAAVKQAIKNVNKYLKKIGKELQIELNITTYVARHTHAGVLKNSGASVEFISESLGHADIATTKNYLNDLEDEKRKEMKKALTSFLNFVK
jgi:integrase